MRSDCHGGWKERRKTAIEMGGREILQHWEGKGEREIVVERDLVNIDANRGPATMPNSPRITGTKRRATCEVGTLT